MQIEILLFATLRDLAGQKRLSLVLESERATIAQVRAQLAREWPQLIPNIDSALAAINQEFAQAGDMVSPGDEVAFFPPVSGGAFTWPEVFSIQTESVDHDALLASITTPETGAAVLFSGFVRGTTRRPGHIPSVTRLEYEAYEPMALAKMRQVAQEIREQYPGVQGIAMVQRIGHLNVGESTVLIACASAHRDDGCFEAARYGIDRLKQIVPIWKREVADATAQWVEGDYTPGPGDRAST